MRRYDTLAPHLRYALEDFGDWQAGEGKSPRTITMYADVVAYFATEMKVTTWASVTPQDIRSFQQTALERHARSYVNNMSRCMRQFWKFMEQEHGIPSPMSGVRAPSCQPQLVPVISPQDMKAILNTCATRSFRDIRDEAILRLFSSSGARLAEVSHIQDGAIDFEHQCVVVVGKGSKPRVIPFDDLTSRALRRYLRARARHRLAHLPNLWLGQHGALTSSGVYRIVQRRGLMAGIKLHPHQLRHTFSHQWLLNGGSGNDLMVINGWSSPAMLQRYGASAATERTLSNYRKVMA